MYQDEEGQPQCKDCTSISEGMGTGQDDPLRPPLTGQKEAKSCVCMGRPERTRLDVLTHLYTPGGRGYYGKAGIKCFECPGPPRNDVDPSRPQVRGC